MPTAPPRRIPTPICPAAGRRQRRLVALLTLGAAASGLALIIALAKRSPRADADDVTPLVLLGSLIALTAAALASRVFRVVGIDRKFTQLSLRPRVADALARLSAPRPPPAP